MPDAECRVCLQSDGILIQPCGCRGTVAWAHESCIREWSHRANRTYCECCQEMYVHVERQIEQQLCTDIATSICMSILVIGIIMVCWSIILVM